MTLTSESLTPVELRDGRWYKREDAYRLANGCNGAKLRACHLLLSGAREAGATRVVSAASVLSPQSAMAAALARSLGMDATVIVGGTTPALAARHTSIASAAASGADLRAIPVGYNPALQKAAAEFTATHPGTYWLRYGITAPPDADPAALKAFHATSALQARNVPPSVRTVVLPFGSGNTGAGVLHGLARHAPWVERVILTVIGPDRQAWLTDRLQLLGTPLPSLPFTVERHDLHATRFARYGDRMPETLDGITLHPTYEGKVARYHNRLGAAWWTRRDSSTLLWIVGGPLPRMHGAPS